MDVSSPVFADHEYIPARYTCQGENISPPLEFSNIPEGTVTLALIMEDPDAPSGTFDHWIVWNLPPANRLEEGARPTNQGVNGFGASNYKGPCPPPGKAHHYYFKVYALSKELNLPKGSNKQQLERTMQGNILDQGVLIGLFKR